MTYETYDNLSSAIGRNFTNREWETLIVENFRVSRNVAKQMLHAMYEVKRNHSNYNVYLDEFAFTNPNL